MSREAFIHNFGGQIRLRKSFTRFALAGIANTVFGYGVFLLFHFGLSLELLVSNVGAYILGLLLSLAQMRLWVFPSQSDPWKYATQFFAIFIVAFIANLTILILLTRFVDVEAWLAQLLAMGTYSLVSFVLARRFLGGQGVQRY